MNSAYRTFILWLLWGTAATTIYLSLYLNTDLLDFLRNDTSRITWIIIGLFILGIIASFLLTVSITSEYIEAVNQQEIAEEKGLMGLEKTGRKNLTVNVFYKSLKIVASNNDSPNIETLLDGIFIAITAQPRN